MRPRRGRWGGCGGSMPGRRGRGWGGGRGDGGGRVFGDPFRIGCCNPLSWRAVPMRASRIFASLALLVTGGLFAAANTQPPAAPAVKGGMPVVSIQEVETNSPQSYALWMGEVNK